MLLLLLLLFILLLFILVLLQNMPFMVMLSRVTADTARRKPRVANVIATVANMCCGMVQRRIYQ